MTNEQAIIDGVRSGRFAGRCDDCMESALDIHPRQQVNQIANRLRDDGVVNRPTMDCAACGKWKIVTTMAR